jgi:hypothetical protein
VNYDAHIYTCAFSVLVYVILASYISIHDYFLPENEFTNLLSPYILMVHATVASNSTYVDDDDGRRLIMIYMVQEAPTKTS